MSAATIRELIADPAFIVLCLVVAAFLIWIAGLSEEDA